MINFFKAILLIMAVSLLMISCAPAETVESAPANQPTATIEPTVTVAPTAVPEPTATLEPTPEPTSAFAGLSDEALSAALFTAVREDDATAVQELIALGVDVNSTERSARLTPIAVATMRNNQEIFSLLLDAGADVTALDNRRNNLLHHAAQNNAVEVATLLFSLDVIDIEQERDQWGFTPLLIAAFAGNVEMVELLVEQGANIEAGDDWEDTPLNVATWNGQLEVVQTLVALGAKPDVVNSNGVQALDHARNRGHEDIETFLLTVIEE